MAREGWFDGQGFDLQDSFVQDQEEHLSKRLADGKVTKQQWQETWTRIFDQLKQLESTLDDDANTAWTLILRDYDILLSLTCYSEDEVISWCSPIQGDGPGMGCPE